MKDRDLWGDIGTDLITPNMSEAIQKRLDETAEYLKWIQLCWDEYRKDQREKERADLIDKHKQREKIMNKGIPEDVGTYLVRCLQKGRGDAAYIVVYVDPEYGILLLPNDSKITHYISIDKLEKEVSDEQYRRDLWRKI